ncbi:MAG: hypothetical protein ACM3JP_01730, partial [Betaproteobacteria bacterium]
RAVGHEVGAAVSEFREFVGDIRSSAHRGSGSVHTGLIRLNGVVAGLDRFADWPTRRRLA